MAHTLILGMTESGKTTLAKIFAHAYQEAGQCVIILDPLGDPGWRNPDAEPGFFYQTAKQGDFLRVVKRSEGCGIFVDEAGESVGRYNTEMQWLATRGRHQGHASFFIAQKATQVAPLVRDQCRRVYVFTSSRQTGKILSEEFNRDEIEKVNELQQFEFFAMDRYGPLRKGKVNPQTKKYTIRSIKS